MTIINRLSKPEAVNERELNAIASGNIDGLVPVVSENIKKETIVRCTVASMFSLQDYLSGIVSPKAFLNAVIRIISIIKMCELKHMNTSNLYLYSNCIFVEPRTKEIKCVFWPVVNNKNTRPPDAFFRELPFQVIFNKYEDSTCIQKYIQFFSKGSGFSLVGFEKMIISLIGQVSEGRQLPSGYTRSEAEQQNDTNSPKTQDGLENVEYNPLLQKTGNNPQRSAALLPRHRRDTTMPSASGIDEAEPRAAETYPHERKMETGQFAGTSVLGFDSSLSGTTVLGATEGNGYQFATLTRVRDGKSIVANKPSFFIGKDPQTSDLCIDDNSTISRTHAEIITRENLYYIVDHKSTNGTQVNDLIIHPNEEHELHPGDRIRLSDEEFLFQDAFEAPIGDK
jgi:hypothetical protein